MRLQDIKRYKDGRPIERAVRAIELGGELKKRRSRPPARGQYPRRLSGDRLGDPVRALLQRLHGVSVAVPREAPGFREIGRLHTVAGEIADLVLTPQARKRHAEIAMRRRGRETLRDAAIRQLALGMFDRAPVPRACSAYAYWQATGADHVARPVLEACLACDDEEAFTVAAHCLAQVKPARLRQYTGTAADDRANSPVRRVTPSMTVLVHGTFAKDQSWYQPGGDFHHYIKRHVYRDLYDRDDLFRWSGRYSESARRLASKKLVQWCRTHPTRKLRLIGHSHGANVINLATQRGLSACVLILLSPPVRDSYLPDMANVSSGRLFNIHSRIDVVVSLLDRSRQNYRKTSVAGYETKRICATIGHSISHAPRVWEKKGFPALVRSVCR